MFVIVPLAKASHMVKLTVNVEGGYYLKGMDAESIIIMVIFVKKKNNKTHTQQQTKQQHKTTALPLAYWIKIFYFMYVSVFIRTKVLFSQVCILSL